MQVSGEGGFLGVLRGGPVIGAPLLDRAVVAVGGQGGGEVAVDGDGRAGGVGDEGAVRGYGREFQAATVSGEAACGLGDGDLPMRPTSPAARSGPR